MCVSHARSKDGHGGRATVDFLTCALHLNLTHYISTHSNGRPHASLISQSFVASAFSNVFSITDLQIARQQIYQSGATAVVALLTSDCESETRMLHVANVGDTRAVLCRNGSALRLSKDHKASDPSEVQMIRKRGGFINRVGRVNGLLAVSRAFGDHLLKPPVSVKPHCASIALLKAARNTDTNDSKMGDSKKKWKRNKKQKPNSDYFVILACDGLWDVMSDSQVTHFIISNVTQKLQCKTWAQVYSQPNYKRVIKQALNSLISTAITKFIGRWIIVILVQ